MKTNSRKSRAFLSTLYKIIKINPASSEGEIRTYGFKVHRISSISSHRRSRRTRNSMELAVRSWAQAVWICIRTSVRVNWCNRRPIRQQQPHISFTKTWMSINRATVSSRITNKRMSHASMSPHNNNNINSSINLNKVKATIQWFLGWGIIFSNPDSVNGEVKQRSRDGLTIAVRRTFRSTFIKRLWCWQQHDEEVAAENECLVIF